MSSDDTKEVIIYIGVQYPEMGGCKYFIKGLYPLGHLWVESNYNELFSVKINKEIIKTFLVPQQDIFAHPIDTRINIMCQKLISQRKEEIKENNDTQLIDNFYKYIEEN